MSTIPSTIDEFNRDLCKFIEITGLKSTNLDSVRAAKKCVVLRYLGISGASKGQIETCALHLIQRATTA